MGQEVEWVDAPPKVIAGGVHGKYREMLKPWKERPGVWGRLPLELDTCQQASAIASRIKRGLVAGVEPGEFDAVARTVDGRHFAYARYVGGES